MGNAERLLQKFQPERDADHDRARVQRLFAEWGQDYALARERNETGKEPPARPIEFKEPCVHDQAKARVRRPSKDIEIPF